VDDATLEKRLEREDFWIRALMTAHPFGLNDKIAKYGLISKGMDPMNHKNHPYFTLRFPARRKPHGRKRRSNKKINMQKISTVEEVLISATATTRDVYLSLQTLSNRNLHHLFQRHKAGEILIMNIMLLF